MLLSIIIPVYNTEKYLSQCIESLFNQDLISFIDFECILVDDGSTDNSLQICKTYAEKYKNILIIEQENSGASKARKAGLENAKGKYLYFCDSDDYISKDFFSRILSIPDYEKYDVIQFGIKSELMNGNIKEYIWKNSNFDFTQLLDNEILWHSLATKIIKTSYLKSLEISKAENLVVGEDRYISTLIFLNTNKIYNIVNYAPYFYRCNNSSIMKTITYDRINQMIAGLDAFTSLTDNKSINVFDTLIYDSKISIKLQYLLISPCDCKGFRLQYPEIKKIRKNSLLPNKRKILFYLGIYHFDFIIKLFKKIKTILNSNKLY